ncbi:MAG: antitoxin [Methyloprofundus sp.]|nr:MAG: antitoxin [Methyloprofundus sp.]
MINITELHPQFITDEKGTKKSVVLSIETYQELIENIEDLAVIAKRKDESTTSHKKLLEELKVSGLL